MSKKFEVEIKLKTPILASEIGEDNVFRFKLNDKGDIVFKPEWFVVARNLTRRFLNFKEPELKSLEILPYIEAEVNHDDSNNEVVKLHNSEKTHEAIRGIVTLHLESDKDIEDELFKEFMTALGKYIGISPWGSRLGYGLFEIV